MMSLFIFMIWLVPLLIAAISGAAGAGEGVAQLIASISPVAGLALATNLGGGTGTQAIQGAALVPALAFAFLFNNLVTVARRRVVKSIRGSAPDAAKPVATPDPLAV